MKKDIIFGREELLFTILDISHTSGVLGGAIDILNVMNVEDIDHDSLKALLENEQATLEKLRLKLNKKYFPREKDDDDTG